jgi:hypothetical protein
MIETNGRTDETSLARDIATFHRRRDIPKLQTDRHTGEDSVGTVTFAEKKPTTASRETRWAQAADAIARENDPPPLGNFFHLQQVRRSRNPQGKASRDHHQIAGLCQA